MEEDDLFEGTTDSDTTDSGSGDEEPAPQKTGDGADESSNSKDDKRIRDLMSRAQKAEAALAKLQKEKGEDVTGAGGSKDGAAAQAPEAAPVDEFTEYMRETVRKQMFDELGLADYGLKPESIKGSTIAEMRASFAEQKALIDTIQTHERSRVLKEHGLTPDIGSTPETKVDFASMPADEFEKWIAKAKGQA